MHDPPWAVNPHRLCFVQSSERLQSASLVTAHWPPTAVQRAWVLQPNEATQWASSHALV